MMQAADHARYRADIDGLRAIAVLAVLVFHANNTWLPGGFVGVDIFFVISGFLITGILLREINNGTYSIRRFYARRVRRIFPALLTVLLGCTIAGWFLLIPKEYETLGKHLSAASLFFSNFKLWKESGYFDAAAELKPLLHLWSLGVEEQFYILWPLLLLIGARYRRLVLPLMITACAVSFALSCLRSAGHPVSSFFLPHTRFWELAAGGLLAYYQAQATRQPSQFYHTLAAVAGLALLAIAIVMLHKLDPFPGWRALLPVLGTLLLLSSSDTAIHRRLLGNRWMVGIGLISYPLYLWHWPLLAFARILYPPPTAVVLCLIALAFVLATATYHFIEVPLRFGRYRGRYLSILLLAMVALGLSGLVIKSTHGFKNYGRTNPQNQDLVGAHDFTKQVIACPASFDAGDNWCSIARPGPVDAAVFGDSHADALFPGLAQQDRARNWMLLGYTSCPPLVDVHSHKIATADACQSHAARALRVLLAHPEIHTVVLASLGPFYLDESISPQHTGELAPGHWLFESARAEEAGLTKAEIFYRGMERMVRALEGAGKRVVLFIDVPTLDFMSSECFARFGSLSERLGMLRTPCAVSREKTEANQKRYRELIARLHRAHPRSLVFDSSDVMCDASQCYAAGENMLYYSDSHHLSIRGSIRMARHFIPWLDESGDKQR